MQQYYYLQKSTKSSVYLRRQMLHHMLNWRKAHAVRPEPYQSVKDEAAVYYKAIFDFKLETDLISLLDVDEKVGVYQPFLFAHYVFLSRGKYI